MNSDTAATYIFKNLKKLREEEETKEKKRNTKIVSGGDPQVAILYTSPFHRGSKIKFSHRKVVIFSRNFSTFFSLFLASEKRAKKKEGKKRERNSKKNNFLHMKNEKCDIFEDFESSWLHMHSPRRFPGFVVVVVKKNFDENMHYFHEM